LQHCNQSKNPKTTQRIQKRFKIIEYAQIRKISNRYRAITLSCNCSAHNSSFDDSHKSLTKNTKSTDPPLQTTSLRSTVYPSSSPTVTPKSTNKPQISTKLKTFNGQYISFNYPDNWNPKIVQNTSTQLETIELEIPELQNEQSIAISDQSPLTIDQIRESFPNAEIKNINIDNNSGYKYILI